MVTPNCFALCGLDLVLELAEVTGGGPCVECRLGHVGRNALIDCASTLQRPPPESATCLLYDAILRVDQALVTGAQVAPHQVCAHWRGPTMPIRMVTGWLRLSNLVISDLLRDASLHY